jgi:predicted nucleotide-binding protein (sugar kinase/HSP70/actin superfamily)
MREVREAVDKARKEEEKVKSPSGKRGRGPSILEKTGGRELYLQDAPIMSTPKSTTDTQHCHQLRNGRTDRGFHRPLGKIERPLRIVDQWSYHTRLYAAACFVRERKDLELVQLNSFGCGLDAVTTDQVQEILQCYEKIYTVLKIDEINNLGAVKIRIRSLKAAMDDRERSGFRVERKHSLMKRVIFTEEMRAKHTILAPQMSPIHFQFLEEAFRASDYRIEILPSVDRKAVDEGLKHVNNDACYRPSLSPDSWLKL